MSEASVLLRTGPTLSSQGEAVGRSDEGRVTFVPGAAPDETVEVEYIKETSRYARAQLLKVVEPSALRVGPRCAHYADCGGCVLQHIDGKAQAEIKWETIREVLVRVGKIRLEQAECHPPWQGAPYGYRSRARFAVSKTGKVGYRKRGSKSVVDISECPILNTRLSDALTQIRSRLRRHGKFVDGEVVVAASGDQLSISPSAALKSRLGVDGSEVLDYKDAHGPLRLSARTFSQCNQPGNSAILKYIETLVASPRAESTLELYCGAGNFSRVLARSSHSLTVVEASRASIRLAREVLPDHVTLVGCPVEKALDSMVKEGRTWDRIFVNPPREGLSAAALDQIETLAPKQLIYVSCAPATFARDVHRFQGGGFMLKQLRFFDLYPQTAHGEVVGELRRGL